MNGSKEAWHELESPFVGSTQVKRLLILEVQFQQLYLMWIKICKYIL